MGASRRVVQPARVWLWFAIAIVSCIFVAPNVIGQSEVLSDVVPKVGLYITEADIVRARERVKTEVWAKKQLDALVEEADYWTIFPDRYFQQLVPPAGSLFSYGKTGCPVDGAPWPNFGGGGVAQLSRPMTLRCPTTGHTIDFDNPDSKYYDPGDGVIIDGVRYHLRGVWNAFVVNQLAGWGNDQGVVHKLTYAYVLTGKEKYAKTAVVIMDALATLMPTTIGPRDFERSATSVEGRLHWLTSIVHRSKMHLIRNYDLLYNVPFMNEVSPTNATNYDQVGGGFTVRQNIEENMLKDYVFGEFDLTDGNLTSLHNHEADELRAMLALGIVLGNSDWVKWGMDGAFAFLDNTIDRDGLYYETSLGYGSFAQNVYLDMAEILFHYDPANYPGQNMPDPADYPYRLNMYDHPKLQQFIVGFRQRVDAAGRMPAYGNASSPQEKVVPGAHQLTRTEWDQVERLHARTSSDADRAVFAQWLRDASQGDIGNWRQGIWNVFHARDVADGSVGPVLQSDTDAVVLGGTGLALLRNGEGRDRRAVLLRGGANLPHAHDDVLGLLIHAKGYELTGDVGYGTFGSPVHLGWGTRQIAHNLVVVDEGLNRNGSTHQVGPGGNVLDFFSAPGISYVEMEAPQMFTATDDVQMYRRGVMHVDVSSADSYIVDVFRVVGGQMHDYAMHMTGPDLAVNDVDLEAPDGVWTLWGLTNPEATFDAPGRSWGERILSGEHIKDLSIPGERVATRFWTPEPGNGYGFIHDIKTGHTDDVVRAEWRLNDRDDTRVAMDFVPQQTMQIVQGKGPNLLGTEQRGHFIARNVAADGPAASIFQAVLEPYTGGQRHVVSVHSLLPQDAPAMSSALKITLRDGRVDYVLSLVDHTSVLDVTDDGVAINLTGGQGIIRTEAGVPVEMHLMGGTRLAYGDHELTQPKGMWEGTVIQADYTANELVVDGPSLSGDAKGRLLLINNDGYLHNSAYVAAGSRVNADGHIVIDVGQSSFVLSRGLVENMNDAGTALSSRIPLPWGFQYGQQTGYFTGKVIVNKASGARAHIDSMQSMKQITLAAPAAEFGPGDSFVVYDTQPGDKITMPLHISKGVIVD